MSETTQDIQVEMKFQVGTATVPLAELTNLAEGMVIEGEALYTYFPKVRAIIGERTVAEGELVKVDDKVAFRITKII